MIKIEPVLKDYEWGSTSLVNEILGIDKGQKIAEAWYGVHEDNSSVMENGEKLSDFIAKNPEKYLGSYVVKEFDGKLPFLMKILGIEKCLSLQVHPSLEEAKAGFGKIEDYKDPFPKPEMLVALDTSYAFNGFKSRDKILDNIANLDGKLIEEIVDIMRDEELTIYEAIEKSYKTILSYRGKHQEAELEKTIQSVQNRYDTDSSPSLVNDGMFLMAASDFENDVTVIATLLLNGYKLNPNDSCYVPSGRIHAYLRGSGIEIMANSDNVVRAGLTPKKVNEELFFELTNFQPANYYKADSVEDNRGITSFEPDNRYFGLYSGELKGQSVELYPEGPRILIVLDGEFELSTAKQEEIVRKGEAYFIGDYEVEAVLRGNGKFALGYVPTFELNDLEEANLPVID